MHGESARNDSTSSSFYSFLLSSCIQFILEMDYFDYKFCLIIMKMVFKVCIEKVECKHSLLKLLFIMGDYSIFVLRSYYMYIV